MQDSFGPKRQFFPIESRRTGQNTIPNTHNMTYKFQSWSWYYWNIIIIPLEPDSDSLEPAQLRRVKFKQFGAYDKKMFVARQIAFSAAATLAPVPGGAASE